MRIATHNVNGIRAAVRRGFNDWIARADLDIFAIQEMRCRYEQLPDAFADYHVAYDAGSLAGRNGVAVVSRYEFSQLRTWGGQPMQWKGQSVMRQACDDRVDDAELMAEFAHEGRYLEVDIADYPLTVASVYIPKGDSPYALRGGVDSAKAQAGLDRKMRFLNAFVEYVDRRLRWAEQCGRQFLLMGDFNIAHENADLKNWKSNHKTSGFLPEERQWMSAFLGRGDLVDVIRSLHPDQDGPYSWWSWRGQAFTNDAGWRIDYHMASPDLAGRASQGWSAREASYDQRISDHCPVCVDYEL